MRKITNTRSAVALAGLSLLLLSGCGSTGGYASGSARPYWGNEAAAALPAPGVYGGYGAYGGSVGFEYARRDGALSARTATPYTALRQWPGPIPPREKPVRFERWEQ